MMLPYLNSELANHKPCLLPLYLSILGLQVTDLTWLRRLRWGTYKHKHNPIYAIYATCRLPQLQKYFPTFGCTNLIKTSTQIHLRLEPWLLDQIRLICCRMVRKVREIKKKSKLLVDVNLWRKFLMSHPRLCWHCQGILACRSSQILTVCVVCFPLLSSRISRRSSTFFVLVNFPVLQVIFWVPAKIAKSKIANLRSQPTY